MSRPEMSRAVERAWAAAVAVGAVAVVVTLASGVAAVVIGFRPMGDHATLGVLAHDVGGRFTPLLGTRSSVAPSAAAAMHHPGPLEIYLLAPFVRLLGGAGIAMGGAVLAALSISAAVMLAKRAGGAHLALACSTGMLALVGAIGVADLASPWPPTAIVIPLTVFTLGCWLAATGTGATSSTGRWTMVVAGTFCAQSQLPTVPLIAVGGLCAVVVAIARRRGSTQRWRELRRYSAPLLVGLVLWTPPIVQQFTSDQPNLTAVINSASGGEQPTTGITDAVAAVTATLSTPFGWSGPRWRTPWFHTDARPAFDEGTAPVLWVVLLGLFTVGAVLAAWVLHPGRRPVRRQLAFCLLAAGALAVGLFSRAPHADGYLSLAWLRWLWAFAVIIWAVLLAEALRATAGPRRRVVVVIALGIAAVSVAAGAARAPEDTAFWFRERDAATRLVDGLTATTRRGERLVVRSDVRAAGVGSAVVWELTRMGRMPIAAPPTFLTHPTAAQVARYAMFGNERRPRSRRGDRRLDVVWIAEGGTAAQDLRGVRVLASGSVSTTDAQQIIDDRVAALDGSLDAAGRRRLARLDTTLERSVGYPVVVVDRSTVA